MGLDADLTENIECYTFELDILARVLALVTLCQSPRPSGELSLRSAVCLVPAT
jgi:hypothetical protein